MTGLSMAWTMFLIIPCPIKRWDENKTPQMLAWFPFIGLICGGIACGIYAACRALNLGVVGLALMTALPWIITGFMHIDGFLDCADAVLSCRDKQRKLEILKDSRVGSFAVVCMVILALFSFAAWAQIGYQANLLALLLIPVASRAMAGFWVMSLKPIKDSSYDIESMKKPNRIYKLICMLFFIACSICAGFLIAGKQGIAVTTCALCTMLTIFKVSGNLGGMCGDISGCATTIGEACGYIALAIVISVS